MERKWIDNAFWETPKKELLNCIAEFTDENGKKVRQVYKLRAKDEKVMLMRCGMNVSNNSVETSLMIIQTNVL